MDPYSCAYGSAQWALPLVGGEPVDISVDVPSENSTLHDHQFGDELIVVPPRVVPLLSMGPHDRPIPLGLFHCILVFVFLNISAICSCDSLVILLLYLVLGTPILDRLDILYNRRKRKFICDLRSGRKKGIHLLLQCSLLLICKRCLITLWF